VTTVTRTRGATRSGAPRTTTTSVDRAASEGAWAGLLVAAFVLYYVAPGLPLSLLLLAVCGVLCYLRLPLAVSLIPLAMPFFMLPKHLTGHQEFALGETAIILCALAYGLQRLLTLSTLTARPDGYVANALVLLRHFVPRSRFERPVALFLAAATAAMLAAHFRWFALREYRLVILEPIIYYVLVVALLRDTRSMLRALWALVASGVLVALLGLGQYVFRRNTLVGVRFTGPASHPTAIPLHLVTSVYGSPDNLALLLDRVIPVAIVLGLAALAPTLPGIRRAPALRDRPGRAARPATLSAPSLPLIAALAVVPMVVALLLTGSRGGILTAVATGLAAVLFWRSQTERRYGPLLTLLSAGGVLGGTALLVLSQIQHGASTATRLYVWRSALAMIRDHPLLGVGPDNFLYYYFPDPHKIDPHPFYNPHVYDCVALLPPSLRAQLPARHYIDVNNAWQEPCLSHPHNAVLHVWLATGLVGLVALAILLVGFVVVARHNLSRLREAQTQARAVQVAAIAVVVATFVHGMVDNSIFVADLAVAFWLAVALTGQLSVASGQLPVGSSQRVVSSGQ